MEKQEKDIIKSTQEQALAAWIMYLNQMRLDTLIERLNQQDINLEEALKELEKLKKFIGDPSHILGSNATKHGEIAEHMQVCIENARRLVRGLARNHTFDGVGRTAPEDYLRNNRPVQSKFYNGLKNTFFNKHGILDHLKMYPDFVKNGGLYDIPKNQYEKLVELINKYYNNPSQLSTSEYYLAKKIIEFFQKNGLVLGKNICPSVVSYDAVQTGVTNNTVDSEEKNIRQEDKRQRESAYEDAKPSLEEGAKAVCVGAVVEGGIAFALAVALKRKSKRFNEFTSDDWMELGIITAENAAKGGIRGGVVYALSNYTATPAIIASAYVTATFGIASQVRQLKTGKISKEDFVINCEAVCLDITVSTISSLMGQALIPIPVLGVMVGNMAGQYVYNICKKNGDSYSCEIINSYKNEWITQRQQLDAKYLGDIIELERQFSSYEDIEQFVFDCDVNKAFDASIRLGREIGVDERALLTNMDQINYYFLA